MVAERRLEGRVVLVVHLELAIASIAVLGLEYESGWRALEYPARWPLAQAFVMAVALAIAWWLREGLRLVGVVVLGVTFQLGWFWIHHLIHLPVAGGGDITTYENQGLALLQHHYPESEYPPGAVILFAAITRLGHGQAATPTTLVMVPLQAVCITSIWLLRTRWTPWLAAFVALWPVDWFFWQYRFDLAPTAALLVGLLAASRGRWRSAGVALGIGFLIKWTPILALAALVVWLTRTRQIKTVCELAAAAVVPILLVYVPLLLWQPHEVLAAYRLQNSRTITAESALYLPLRLFGLGRPNGFLFAEAHVPAWANALAGWFTLGVVLATIALAARVANLHSAVAIAALAPVAFFLSNRIFSPQFFVTVLAAFVVAAAVVCESAPELLVIAATLGVASLANEILYPTTIGKTYVYAHPNWTFISAAALVPCMLVLVWLARRAVSPLRTEQAVYDPGGHSLRQPA